MHPARRMGPGGDLSVPGTLGITGALGELVSSLLYRIVFCGTGKNGAALTVVKAPVGYPEGD
jgi:hypothetical protein